MKMEDFKKFVIDEITKSNIDKDDLFNIWVVNFNKEFVEKYDQIQNKIDNLSTSDNEETVDKIQLSIWQLQDYYNNCYRWHTKGDMTEPHTLSTELIKLQRLFRTKLLINKNKKSESV